MFVYSHAKCTIVQHSGDCACLSCFSNAGGKERVREKTATVFEEFDKEEWIEGILQTLGFGRKTGGGNEKGETQL